MCAVFPSWVDFCCTCGWTAGLPPLVGGLEHTGCPLRVPARIACTDGSMQWVGSLWFCLFLVEMPLGWEWALPTTRKGKELAVRPDWFALSDGYSRCCRKGVIDSGPRHHQLFHYRRLITGTKLTRRKWTRGVPLPEPSGYVCPQHVCTEPSRPAWVLPHIDGKTESPYHRQNDVSVKI